MQNLNNVKENIKNTKINETAANAKDKAIDLGENIKNQALELGSTLKDNSIEFVQTAKEKALGTNEIIIQVIKNNPYKSIGISLFVGFMIGKFCNFSTLMKEKDA